MQTDSNFAILLVRLYEAVMEEKWLSRSTSDSLMRTFSDMTTQEVENYSQIIIQRLASMHTEKDFSKMITELFSQTK